MTNSESTTPPTPPLIYKRGSGGVPEIVQAIDRLPNQFLHKLIGIDGLGASGKTTIAEEIKKAHPETSIIYLEEFFKKASERTEGIVDGEIVSPDFDWDRFENQVIKPVQKNLLVKYERFDWRADTWNDWLEVPAVNWIIIVGVYALQSRFFQAYDYSIWMDVPQAERIKRMTEREGLAVSEMWQTKWLPREEHYYEIERPDNRASVVLSE